MERNIGVANQKGGVGKTTTGISLAASLAQRTQRVLLVDVDPQANATSGLGIQRAAFVHSTYQLLVLNEPITNLILPTTFGLAVVPSDRNLAGAEIELVDFPDRELLLRSAISPIREGYDFIIIDCPPALNVLTLNSLTAADALFILI